MYDCIIIGAGHNGLICSNYLARKGWNVLVLEKRHLVGGACVTEEISPGYRASIASYVVSLLLPEIIEELELKKHGYKTLPRNPSSFTPFDDGRYLFLGPDQKANYDEIKKFSEKDAKAFGDYEAFLGRVAERIEPALLQLLRELLDMLEIEIGVRIRARVAPRAGMDGDRPHEGAKVQLTFLAHDNQ